MKIILTHEQADFDALASLFGAHLLDEDSIPVLPRRSNRNVQAFLTLYGVDLPFVDPRDLPSQPIDAVTLVDTQSLVSIRGMSPATRVSVIDHHPMRDNLPPEWNFHREETGATTTLIVDFLREQTGAFSPIQATLLLLGIYEDTGSLTYTRTTARDLRAAAFLLDQGANLQIATNFLNHPLSLVQQQLYDLLRANAEIHQVHGHTIIIAMTEARELDEELSTITHRLRDLLDPDALIVLVTTRGGVQMIARSSSDHIDVAKLLGYLGGGGHERAAAGLVHSHDLAAVHDQLVKLLPDVVRPAVTVAQIMSRGLQVFPPSTPVEEIAQRMRRFGHEGYPVVLDGKVIGLVTRRSIDRAINIGHFAVASRLMDKGEFSVRPNDSIERLQRVMADSGWGQIPVVDPKSGEIIGIVTRTDLLKVLAPEASLPGRQNLADRLESVLPETRINLLKAIAQVAHERHAALYIVGGFVRDLLLGRPSLDFDLVVEGDAIKLAHALAQQHGGRVTSHSRFGTAKWHLEGSAFSNIKDEVLPGLSMLQPQLLHSIDLVSARTEFYSHPTALPTVERSSIKLDLHRRDFTINTLALRLDGQHYGELHDYWGGLSDLKIGLVRALHSVSFVDDPTRMLRAARFEQRFNFQIEARTMELLQDAISLIDRVSGDRIRHELNSIIVDPCAPMILSRLDEFGLLTAIDPNLFWDGWLSERFSKLSRLQPDPGWELAAVEKPFLIRQNLAYTLWLLRMSLQQADHICGRLRIPIDLSITIKSAIRLWEEKDSFSVMPVSQVVARLDELPILAVYVVYLASDDPALCNILCSYASQWRHIQPVTDGNILRRMGIPPGPSYRKILTTLRNSWLDGEIATPEIEQKFLHQLLVDEGLG